jgi:hypothetical protein
MLSLATLPAFALLNRARGTKLYGLTNSTVVGRLVATLGMGVLASLCVMPDSEMMLEVGVWTWLSLFLWAIPAWDNYWGAAIGSVFNPDEPAFAPVDWLLRVMPWFSTVYAATASDLRRRLWGATAMGLRQMLATPGLAHLAFIAGHPDRAWYAICPLAFGLFYLAAGYLKVLKQTSVAVAEYGIGAALGFLIVQSIN